MPQNQNNASPTRWKKTRWRQWFIALFFLGRKGKKGEGYRALFDPSYCLNTVICRTYQLFIVSIMKVTTFLYIFIYTINCFCCDF